MGVRVHETADPEVIGAEFEYGRSAHATGATFAYPCVFVLRVRHAQDAGAVRGDVRPAEAWTVLARVARSASELRGTARVSVVVHGLRA